MTTLADATVKQLFAEIRKRLKNEITKEEFTEEFWGVMEPTEQQIRYAAEEHDLFLSTKEEIAEEVEASIPDTEIFKLVTRLAYLKNTATIKELNELQFEARHRLSTDYGQFHQMGLDYT